MEYYNGPNPRYVQYTKGFTTAASHQIERGTVEYTRFGSEYFSGANVGIYFGDILVDQIFGLQFNLQEQVVPIFGYGSYTYDAVAKGQRLINGSFNVYFRESAYLKLILDKIEEQGGGAKKSNPFKYDVLPEETTIERILQELASKSQSDFNKLASSYEQAIWGGEQADIDATKGKTSEPYFTPFKDVNLNKTGFDILIAYGPESRRQKSNLGDLSAKTTVQSINGVHLTSVGVVIDASGQPIFEQYTFMAKDLNGNIHKKGINNTGGAQPAGYPTLRIGSTGAEVRTLQAALNAFLANESEDQGFEDMVISVLGSIKISVDGSYGDKTKGAVRIFQEFYNLTADGVCGPKTWAKLQEENYI